MPEAETDFEALRNFEQSIETLGLPVATTIADLTSLFRALARPSRLEAAMRHLELEWLGAADPPRTCSPYPSRAELMHVLSRSIGIDVTECFHIHDLQNGMAYSVTQIMSLVADGHLWVYGDLGTQFPRWQFTCDREGLPTGFISQHLQVVVAAIPNDANPGLVRSLMTLGTPSLPTVRGRELSPREFLLSGGAPSVVAALLLRYLDADASRIHDVARRVSAWT